MKHGGGSIILWKGFCLFFNRDIEAGQGQRLIQLITEQALKKTNCQGFTQLDPGPFSRTTHHEVRGTICYTSENLHVLEWSNQSPDLWIFGRVWKLCCRFSPSGLTELKGFFFIKQNRQKCPSLDVQSWNLKVLQVLLQWNVVTDSDAYLWNKVKTISLFPSTSVLSMTYRYHTKIHCCMVLI